MAAPKEILDLLERFDRNRETYRSGNYNETQLRREFLDPFFKALGWDVENTAGHAEAYKDIIHEDAIKVGGATKAPDYCFRIGGTRKFFVEAKKPSVNIAEGIEPAYQLRRYAWSAKLPLSILTDFEEFAVYDCRIKPDKGDKASKARIMYLTERDYLGRWEEIAAIFSKDAVLRGSFDKYADTARLKKGTAGVDAAFLKEIEIWREMLARNIALRNPKLSQRELNAAVTLTINRIIFLRICEDRGIETYGQLMALKNGSDIYERLIRIFYSADDKYNSGLFHFRAEKDRKASPDTLTLNLAIDDRTFKDIFGSLYYPESPYEFSVLSADILGQVYEQFLGKIIHLTVGHRATVEDKPEVKKAGGVYYTPTYIVDYIVKNTVGKLLPSSNSNGGSTPAKSRKAVTPRQAAGIRILDPACGSGSFLLGAYQYLLDWHLTWYVGDGPEKWRKGKSPVLCQGQGGDWRLTTSERKRILLNNIYGVDIDPQAVEVTKLSLLLKVLEGENEQTLSNQLRLFRERALPDLANNIKCGNSLIGPDFYDNQQLGFFDNEERYRINVFDWEKEFPEIFASKSPSPPAGEGRGEGGFDAVIGNPPYVRQEMIGNFKSYFQEHYRVYHGSADFYVYFIEKGVSLLNPAGFFSYIVANKWMRANYGEPLRKWLKQQDIQEIIDFGDLPVFKDATTYPCIIRVKKGKPPGRFSVAIATTLQFESLDAYVQTCQYPVQMSALEDNGWSITGEKTRVLLKKLKAIGIPLGNYAKGEIYRGILTGLNEAFVIDSATRDRLTAEDPMSSELIKPFLAGRDIKRCHPLPVGKFLIFTRRGIDIKKYPAIEKHLQKFKEKLMPKPADWKGTDWKGRKPGQYKWYEIQDAIDYFAEFEKPKIIVPAIVQKASYTFDHDGFLSNDKTTIIAVDDLYLLGMLNSKVCDFVMHSIASTKQGGYYEYKPMYLSQLPIRIINFTDSADKARHDRMVVLVEQMLSLHKRLAEAKTDHEKTNLKRQLDATDRQIDRLVYELYELTEEEIKIVEGDR
jgi:type I restriction-modification system DNA methylase subunit